MLLILQEFYMIIIKTILSYRIALRVSAALTRKGIRYRKFDADHLILLRYHLIINLTKRQGQETIRITKKHMVSFF